MSNKFHIQSDTESDYTLCGIHHTNFMNGVYRRVGDVKRFLAHSEKQRCVLCQEWIDKK